VQPPDDAPYSVLTGAANEDPAAPPGNLVGAQAALLLERARRRVQVTEDGAGLLADAPARRPSRQQKRTGVVIYCVKQNADRRPLA
jgi:hypothetical protein